MYKKILFALDMEGVNNIVGDPYSGLVTTCEQYQIAIHQAALEINAAAEALFDIGVESIDLWDNHSGGHNVIPEEIDKRINILDPIWGQPRMYFAQGNKYDCICFFGYHAMEGTLGGVLAHTMNSGAIQHYKLNGKYIGEVDMDSYIAASHGMPSRFFAGGDITCMQAKNAIPEIVTTVTKKELSRNEAVFRDNAELFEDIQKNIVEAVKTEAPIRPLAFPAKMEKSFKRTEDAAKYLSSLRSKNIVADHPDDSILIKDAHTVVATVNNIDEFIKCI